MTYPIITAVTPKIIATIPIERITTSLPLVLVIMVDAYVTLVVKLSVLLILSYVRLPRQFTPATSTRVFSSLPCSREY